MGRLTIKTSFSFSILIFSILVQAWGENSAGSACGGVLELSSGVLDFGFSPVDGNAENSVPDLCVWVIKLPVTSQNIRFQLTQIPQSSQLNLYSQAGHVAGQFSILPIATLTSENVANSTIDVNDSNVIAIWTPSRAQNASDADGALLSFKWDSVKVQSAGNGGRDLDLVGGVNYVEADRGRLSWVKPGESQQTLLWVLNSNRKSDESLELKIETEFEKCELVDPCLCSYLGVYEVYDNFLRAVSTECGRSSNVQVGDLQPHLVALGFVNPEFRRDTNHVTLSWQGKQPEEGTTTTTTTTTTATTPTTPTTPTTTTTTEIPTTTTEQVPTTCSSGFPKSCSEIQSESGSNSSQLENCLIYPNGSDGESLEVLCDFGTDKGGWTIFQKRFSGPQGEFNKTWDEYSEGFGSLFGNFWLGLDNIHALTKDGDQELRIELEDFEGEKAYAKYSRFSISDASDFYRLTLSGFSPDSTAGDSMTSGSPSSSAHLNGMRFSTKDKDNDLYSVNCAVVHGGGGGWWYNACSLAELNRLYQEKGEAGGIRWYTWKVDESLAKTEIKIRKRKSESKSE